MTKVGGKTVQKQTEIGAEGIAADRIHLKGGSYMLAAKGSLLELMDANGREYYVIDMRSR
jgi:hypothetical protein